MAWAGAAEMDFLLCAISTFEKQLLPRGIFGIVDFLESVYFFEYFDIEQIVNVLNDRFVGFCKESRNCV